MEYMVTGPDGKEYGPAGIETLKQWVQEDRLRPDSMLRDFATARSLRAGDIPGLFSSPGPVGPGAPPSLYSGTPYRPQPNPNAGSGALWGSLIRSVLAVVVFFFIHGLGVIFAIYGVIYAFQAKSHGNKYGTIAIVISLLALVTVIVGWGIRLSSGAV